jgi:transcriptional regulator with GAF, ATPase, and Fis domain
VQLAALQSVALSVAQAQSPEHVLTEVVRGLGMTEGVALARVWLVERGPSETALRLSASVGLSRVDPGLRWNRTDGAHARLPINYGKVGQIASTGEPVLLQKGPANWLVQPEWAEREQIESFAGQPLVFRGEVLGVLAVFSRRRLEREDLSWLRVFADHAAVAIANTRAYAEIAELKERLERERDYLRDAVRDALHPVQMVAESAPMRHVVEEVRAVARTASTVLITGESGVGKELVASAIHDLSPRADQPLVKVNCATVPRELFESEFFGHVRGAFSGAIRNRDGRFQLADKGTLFLDEVGEIPTELQGKLLRVLQEQEFEPVGDDRTRRVDVRLVAATNRDLEREVQLGRFRRDLYYRLSVFPLHVPALRERPEDIAPLARQFLSKAALRLGIPAPTLTQADVERLERYSYPGNIRELRNIIERALVLHRPGSARLVLHLPADLTEPPSSPSERVPAGGAPPADAAIIPADRFKELERENVLNALRRCHWKVAGPDGAAQLLGLSPSTLSYRVKMLGITRDPTDTGR